MAFHLSDTRRKPAFVVALLFFFAAAFACRHSQAQQPIQPFTVVDLSGEKTEIAPDKTTFITALYFTGIECPLARLYGPRVAKLANSYADKKVKFIAINSNQQDSPEEFKQFASEFQFNFQCYKDLENVVADQLEVKRTPEVILLDQDFKIQYRGRVDDQYSPGISRNKPKRHDLKIALDELLSGKTPAISKTEPEGCLLGRVKKNDGKSEVTFANQISRIFQKNCVECHRTGDIGPFVLDDYDEAVGWADMIAETIGNGRMPPWHADSAHGEFTNARSLSEKEKQLIQKWVDDGAPLGDTKNLPPKQTFIDGWQLSKSPDVVIPMGSKPFTIPATGTVDYQYFVVDPKFETDKWILETQVVPGSRSVVHHSIVFIRPPDGASFKGVGWLGAYVPGQKNLKLDPTRARFVPAGSKLVFQQHYTPNGTEQDDITKVGLVFADEKTITKELITLMAIDQQFEIKPHASNHKVKTSLDWLPKNGQLLSVSPHMHFRGKSFKATFKSEKGDGVLLHVPKYDFNWQHNYQFAEPIELNDIASITADVTFDNSADNPFNPDPTQFVTWGDQTWEEMAVGFFDVAIPRLADDSKGKKAPKSMAAKEKTNSNNEVALSEKDKSLNAEVDEFVDEFFDRFDANKDDLVSRDELPLSIRAWGMNRYQSDGKSGLTRKEIAEQARRRFKRRINN